ALAPEVLAVQQLPAHVLDILSMTSLRHNIDVSTYLRGADRESRYVEVCWRTEVPLLAELNDADFEAYMIQMRGLSFEKLNETVKREKEIIAEIVKQQGDAQTILIEADGTQSGLLLSELQGMDLHDCLLLLPVDRGGLTGGMFSVTNADNAQL